MRWPLTIVVMLLVLAVSMGLYRLASEVQSLERQLASATAQLKDNYRNSRILAAELSYLSQPGRLQDLALRHLALQPLVPAQISDLASLPFRSGVAALVNDQDAARLDGPPVPGWKPNKPNELVRPAKPTKPNKPGRGERIVLASTRGAL